MLGSIEKERKLPQFGRRYNVTFFNKMYPLSWLAQYSPIEHFIVFWHLALPATEGSWHRVPGVTKSLCVPTSVFTFLRGLEGRAALLFFSSPVTNGLWQAPRRSKQKLLELVGARSAPCPWSWGRGWNVILSEGTQWLSSGSDRFWEATFLGDKQTPMTAMEGSC